MSSRRQNVPLNMFLRAADPMPPLFDPPNEGDFYYNTTFHVMRIFKRDRYSDPITFSWQDLTTGGSAELGKDTTWTYVGPNDPGDPTLAGNPDGLNAPIWIDTDAGIDEGGGGSGGDGGAGGHQIMDEGAALPARPALDFVGAGVTATDAASITRVAIPMQTIVQSGPPNPTGLPNGTWWVDEDSVATASVQTRTTTTKTTATLGAGAGESGTIVLSNGYRLYRITTNYPARTRLYTTAAKRDADVSRPVGTDPVLDHGVMFEFISDPTLLAADLSPMVDGYDGKTVPDGIIPYRITNIDTVSRAVTVTLSWIRTE